MDPVVDGAITSGLLAGWVASEALFKKSLAPPTCRWCDRALEGTDALNPLDAFGRGIRARESQLLGVDMASNLVSGMLPLAAIGVDLYLAASAQALAEAPLDLLIVAEAAAAAISLNQVVKFIAGRERPFVHVLPEAEKPLTRLPEDNNLSFYSGHSTFAFAVAVGAGTVAQLRGYPRAWLVWLVTLPIAASVPLLRMGADRHYLTDVLVGSGLGAAFGYALPALLHGRVAPGHFGLGARLVPIPGGAALEGTFQ